MKKDDDKSKRTLSGKKPATFGGANSKLIKPKASALSGPRALPSRPMGKDATGSANFDRTSSSRFMVSAGPATMSMGGKTAKSTGGMDMSKGTVKPNKSNPMAKKSAPPKTGMIVMNQKELDEQAARAKRSENVAKIAIGTVGIGAALSSKKVRQGIAKPFKYIADTKERKARNRAQKAENDAMIVERNKGKATVKASKRTMEGLRRARKGQ